MARGDQLGRQWKIIHRIMASRRGKSVSELAQGLDCHTRTVYRDLEALQIAGFPLYTEARDGKTLWRFLDSAKTQIPIPFSITELMALYFSRDLLKMMCAAVFQDSLDSLFDKINAILGPQYKAYLSQFEKTHQVGLTPRKDYGAVKPVFEALNAALMNQNRVQITYRGANSPDKTVRNVDPYRMWFFKETFYLIGHCHLRGEVRIFALDRIQEVRPLDELYQIPESFDMDKYMEASFGVFRGEPVRTRVWFSPRVAPYIRETIWHASQTILEEKDGGIVFEARVAQTDELEFWIMGWGTHARVLAPESLRRSIAQKAAAVAGLYETGAGAENRKD